MNSPYHTLSMLYSRPSAFSPTVKVGVRHWRNPSCIFINSIISGWFLDSGFWKAKSWLRKFVFRFEPKRITFVKIRFRILPAKIPYSYSFSSNPFAFELIFCKTQQHMVWETWKYQMNVDIHWVKIKILHFLWPMKMSTRVGVI